MSWVVGFWVLYGVGSTLFVVYLFKIGKTVASNRNQLIRQEIERIRNEGAAMPTGIDGEIPQAVLQQPEPEQSDRLHFQRVFQPDEEHVAIQSVRDGVTRLINLPVGQAPGLLQPEPRSSVEKVS